MIVASLAGEGKRERRADALAIKLSATETARVRAGHPKASARSPGRPFWRPDQTGIYSPRRRSHGLTGRTEMQCRTYALAAIAFALSLFAAAGTAATAQRTFVASTGNDANPCSIAQPCRGFAAAIVRQSGRRGYRAGFSRVRPRARTISQSVSIIAPPGVYAGISVFSGDGVTVSAGATDKVLLRGLTINGEGGTGGIRVTSGKESTSRTARLRIWRGTGLRSWEVPKSRSCARTCAAIAAKALLCCLRQGSRSKWH